MKTISLRRRHILLASLGASGLLTNFSSAAQSAAWPTGPIRIICNYPPGSAPDILARAIAPPLSKALAQPIVVENRTGASGMIGAEAVARSAADGNTLLMTAGSAMATNPHLLRNLSFDPLKDLTPVAAVTRSTVFLVVRNDLPVSNVQEFIAYLKANPGKLSYGSAGNGTGLHIAAEMFKAQAGVEALHVPYKGAGQILQDLMGGQIHFYFDPGISLALAREGKVKVLGVASLQRSPVMPNTPTLHESGLSGFDGGITHGFYAPSRTPPEIIRRLNEEVNAALLLPQVRTAVQALSGEPSPMSVAAFKTVMMEDYTRYGKVIRDRGITSE